MQAARAFSHCVTRLSGSIASICQQCFSSIARLPRILKIRKFKNAGAARLRRNSGSFNSYFEQRLVTPENQNSLQRAAASINAIRRARTLDNESYADKALKTPANFINWLFRFCFIYSFLTLGAFIGQHIGCMIEKGDKCAEDVATLLERKVGSIAAWVMGVLFSAVLDLLANRLWRCFSARVDSCLEGFQTWAKDRKARVVIFLGGFYGLMVVISGAVGFVAERYGEGKIWPKNSGTGFAMIGFAVGASCGVIISAILLIKPLIKRVGFKKFAFCNAICNCFASIAGCAQRIGALFSRSALPDRANIAEHRREDLEDDDNLGLELPLRRQGRAHSDFMDEDEEKILEGSVAISVKDGAGVGFPSSGLSCSNGSSRGAVTTLESSDQDYKTMDCLPVRVAAVAGDSTHWRDYETTRREVGSAYTSKLAI